MSQAAPAKRRRTCPTCKTRFEEPSPEERRALPFCSARCQMADLGRWLGGEYAVPTEERPSDDELLDALRQQ